MERKEQTSVSQPPALPVFSSAPLLEESDGSSRPSRPMVCRHPPQRRARKGAWSEGQQLDNWHNTQWHNFSWIYGYHELHTNIIKLSNTDSLSGITPLGHYELLS